MTYFRIRNATRQIEQAEGALAMGDSGTAPYIPAEDQYVRAFVFATLAVANALLAIERQISHR